jgi:hypothetical protein
MAATQPPPVLRLIGPPLPQPVRFALRAPVPALSADTVPIAAVGVQGTGGTRVVNVPADLTKPGVVYITQFRIALTAGVW